MTDHDFSDPAIHTQPPWPNVLHWLETIGDGWSSISPSTDGDESAVVFLETASAIQTRMDPKYVEFRYLVESGRLTTSSGNHLLSPP